MTNFAQVTCISSFSSTKRKLETFSSSFALWDLISSAIWTAGGTDVWIELTAADLGGGG